MAAGQYGGRPPKVKCAPPGADERIAMFGTFHGYSHTISTSSSSAQKLVNQASFPHVAGLTSTHRGVGLRILFALDSETDAEHTGIGAYTILMLLTKKLTVLKLKGSTETLTLQYDLHTTNLLCNTWVPMRAGLAPGVELQSI